MYVTQISLFGSYNLDTCISLLIFIGVPEVQEAIEVWLEELFAVVHTLDTGLQGVLGNN